MKFFILLGSLAIVRAYPRTVQSFDHGEPNEFRNIYQVPMKYLQTVAEISSDFKSVTPISDLPTVGNKPAIENVLPNIVTTKPELETTIGNEILEKVPTKQQDVSNISPTIFANFPEIQAQLEAILGPGIEIVDVVQVLGYPEEIYYSLDGEELPTVIDNKKRFLKPTE